MSITRHKAQGSRNQAPGTKRYAPSTIHHPPKSTKMPSPTLNPRPRLLTWLCTGSAIFGISWVVMLITLIGIALAGNLPSKVFPGLAIEYFHAGYLFMITLILLTGLGLTGVAMMWKMKKTGFYLYVASKTLIYFLPVLVIGSSHLTYPALIITSIMITFYGIIFTDTHRNSKKKLLKK